MRHCKLIRPGPGQRIRAVLLGGLTDLHLHWVKGEGRSWRTLVCTEDGNCPFCPGRPERMEVRWYGPAAEFSEQVVHPTEADHQAANLRKRAGMPYDAPRSRYIRTVTDSALAEIGNGQICELGDRERRGLIVEWHKGSKTSPVTVKVVATWELGLAPEFDWLPAAEMILNNGCPIRLADEEKPADILKFKRQA